MITSQQKINSSCFDSAHVAIFTFRVFFLYFLHHFRDENDGTKTMEIRFLDIRIDMLSMQLWVIIAAYLTEYKVSVRAAMSRCWSKWSIVALCATIKSGILQVNPAVHLVIERK